LRRRPSSEKIEIELRSRATQSRTRRIHTQTADDGLIAFVTPLAITIMPL
jgi:hypothetical protein